jgi:hypothetical protein
MKTHSRILTAVTSLCLAGLLASCASTRVAGIKKVSGLATVAPHRVLVLAVLGTAASRRAVEDEVVRQLTLEGVSAVPGYSLSPDSGDLSKPRLTQALADCGADAALVCRWHLVRQKSQSRSPDRVQQTAYGEARLLAATALGTLWSATTTTDLPAGFLGSASEYARTLVRAIQNDGALSCGSKPAVAQQTAPTRAVPAQM